MLKLMGIELFLFTGDQLGEIRKKHINNKHFWSKMPKFTIDRTGRFVEAEYWLAWIESGEEKYWLFDIVHEDEHLREETSLCGYTDFVEPGIDSINEIFKNLQFTLGGEDFLRFVFRPTSYLVFDLHYEKCGRGLEDMYDEYDLTPSLVGYLNENLELIKF